MGPTETTLNPHHRASLLADSGISQEVVNARGYRTVTKKAELKALGFSTNQLLVPALLIPVRSATGEIATYQARPDSPRIKDGKPVKYETLNGSRIVLDVHPTQRLHLGNPNGPLFITEGVKKADALTARGVCAIGLLGVWNWRGTNDLGGKTALPDWEYVALNSRRVYIVFDSDVMLKRGVHAALSRLKGFLETKQADVALIYLPSSAGGGKQGVDDFLAAGSSLDDLLLLATTDLRPVQDEVEDEATEETGASQATMLVALAAQADLFHDDKGDTYAAIEIDGHRETWSTRSGSFKKWLALRFYTCFGKSARGASMSDALTVIEAQAQYEGDERNIWTRIAKDESGDLYLDLGDAAWRAVKITSSGWSVEQDHPIHFRRGQSNCALPVPVRGGSVEELRGLINFDSDDDLHLVIGWLLGCLRPEGPYPVLAFVAEQGSGKSSAARFLRSLVDPSPIPLRAMTRDERDLVIAARANHVVALDNVSHLPQWVSDALCRMATGAGWATRRLYTDSEEEVFSQSRPVLLTGIEDYVSNADLLDRTMLVNLPTIPPQHRRQESELNQAFETIWPRVLGALLDAVSCSLRTVRTVSIPVLPRMADFAAWVIAGEEALGWQPGTFLSAYLSRAINAQEIVLESSLLSDPIRELAGSTSEWQGNSSELLKELNARVSEEVRRNKSWPQSPRGLSGAVRRLAPTLRSTGTDISFGRDGNASRKRLITIRGFTPETTVQTVQPVQAWTPHQAELDAVDGLDGRETPINEAYDDESPDRVLVNAGWSEEVL